MVAGTATTAPITRAFIDGPRGNAPFELFAVSDNRTYSTTVAEQLETRHTIAHFDGTAWEVLQGGTIANPLRNPVAVVWIGPGEALIYGVAEPLATVLHIKDKAILKENASSAAVSSIEVVEDGTVYLGTADGRAYRRTLTGWSIIKDMSVPINPRYFLPLAGGLVFGGEAKIFQFTIAALIPSLGVCVGDPLSDLQVIGGTRLGTDSIVTVGDPLESDALPVTIATVSRGIDTCSNGQGRSP
jgi:hypothetical protein